MRDIYGWSMGECLGTKQAQLIIMYIIMKRAGCLKDVNLIQYPGFLDRKGDFSYPWLLDLTLEWHGQHPREYEVIDPTILILVLKRKGKFFGRGWVFLIFRGGWVRPSPKENSYKPSRDL